MTSNAERTALDFKRASALVEAVRKRFEDKPNVYKRFLDLIPQFEGACVIHSSLLRFNHSSPFVRADMAKLIEEVSTLFHGHSDLFNGFKMFLPSNRHIVQRAAAEELAPIPLQVIAHLNIYEPIEANLLGFEFEDVLSTQGSPSLDSDVRSNPENKTSSLDLGLCYSYIAAVEKNFSDNPRVVNAFSDILSELLTRECVLYLSFDGRGSYILFLQN